MLSNKMWKFEHLAEAALNVTAISLIFATGIKSLISIKVELMLVQLLNLNFNSAIDMT
jgi:hypothetical protein